MSKVTYGKVNHTTKRIFDITLSLLCLLFLWWIIFFAWIVVSIQSRSNGMFVQKRVGKSAKIFNIYKIKTMINDPQNISTITTIRDTRITKVGSFLRRYKIDELPQLVNILKGDMSFVGPRPDVPGYADMLRGDDAIVLSIRPGITGPATLKYHNEEEILSKQKNPKLYNDSVIWPDKVEINKEYIYNWSLKGDVIYLIKTILGFL